MSESAAAAPTAADAAATPKPAPADLYAVLGCTKGDDAPLITKRYRKLAVSLGSQVRCYEMEQAAFRGHADSIGIHKLPAIHVYAGGEKVEDLVCGPSHFKEVRDLLAKDPKNRLDLKENVDSGVYVKDLTSFIV